MIGATDWVYDWGAIFAGFAAIITAVAGARAVVRRIGDPNGKGNVVQMNERQLQKLDEICNAVARLEGAFAEHVRDHWHTVVEMESQSPPRRRH